MTTVWHYTIDQDAIKILACNYIDVATEGVAPPEKPIVWFSKHPVFEPTAYKKVITKSRIATWEEMVAARPIRFGMSAEKLVAWPNIADLAKIPDPTVKELIDEAIRRNANPADWYGSLQSVSLPEILTMERYVNGVWIADQRFVQRD